MPGTLVPQHGDRQFRHRAEPDVADVAARAVEVEGPDPRDDVQVRAEDRASGVRRPDRVADVGHLEPPVRPGGPRLLRDVLGDLGEARDHRHPDPQRHDAAHQAGRECIGSGAVGPRDAEHKLVQPAHPAEEDRGRAGEQATGRHPQRLGDLLPFGQLGAHDDRAAPDHAGRPVSALAVQPRGFRQVGEVVPPEGGVGLVAVRRPVRGVLLGDDTGVAERRRRGGTCLPRRGVELCDPGDEHGHPEPVGHQVMEAQEEPAPGRPQPDRDGPDQDVALQIEGPCQRGLHERLRRRLGIRLRAHVRAERLPALGVPDDLAQTVLELAEVHPQDLGLGQQGAQDRFKHLDVQLTAHIDDKAGDIGDFRRQGLRQPQLLLRRRHAERTRRMHGCPFEKSRGSERRTPQP